MATTVMALVVAALGVFTKAVMDGSDEATRIGNATQIGRVVLSRIAHKVEPSRQVLKMSDALRSKAGMDQVLLVWERDGDPNDMAPGQVNFVELVIFAPAKNRPTQLWEIRPQVDPALTVPLDLPDLLFTWIELFRSGQSIVQPPTVVLDQLGGIHFEVDEYTAPEGIGGLVQQNVRTSLCISPPDQLSTVFFWSATRRYVP